MAGRGPAPKAPDQRRNRVPPARGEWTEIPSNARIGQHTPKLPGAGWSKPARERWAAWWAMPVASMWDKRDDSLVRLLLLWVKFFEADGPGSPGVSAEMRQIEDRLGLNEKGRRDLRWRIVEPKPATTKRAGGKVISPDRWRDLGV